MVGVLLCSVVHVGLAQVIRVNAGPLTPTTLDGRSNRRNDDPPSIRSVALYATAFLGEPGQVEGLPPNSGAHFPTVHLLFSAAAFPKAAGETEIPLLHNLRQFNAHVQIVPLDSAQREVAVLGALEILGTFPDTMVLAQHIVDTSSIGGAAFKTATRALLLPAPGAVGMLGKRVGPLVAQFAGIFHHRRSPGMVPYISDAHEFGWVWHESPDELIEGTHRAAATLEVQPQVRFLQIRIQLVADWRSHGAWQREIEIVIDLGPGPPSPAQ